MSYRNVFFPAILLCAMCSFTVSAEDGKKDEIPTAIQAPAGTKLLHKAKAKGKQIYVGVKGENGLEWKLEAPSAQLTVGAETWTHYKGPTWEAADGSKVKKADGKDAVTPSPAPNAADIPWLLIKVVPDGDKKGTLSGIVSFSGSIHPAEKHPRNFRRRKATKLKWSTRRTIISPVWESSKRGERRGIAKLIRW